MGTTTKMAIPYPEATGLVKDGWEDMKDIATQVDAKSGLVLLNTTSFTAVSSQSITQFSANYENYRVILRINSHNTTGGNHNLRMRSGSTDASGNDYYVGGIFNYANSGSVNVFAQNAQAQMNIGSGSAGGTGIFYIIDFVSPFLASKTNVSWQVCADNSTYTYGGAASGVHALNNSYDGFSIIAAAGSITGKVATFGYNF